MSYFSSRWGLGRVPQVGPGSRLVPPGHRASGDGACARACSLPYAAATTTDRPERGNSEPVGTIAVGQQRLQVSEAL